MAIIFFSGSTRKESYNTKLVNFAYKYALSKGIESKMIDLKHYEMPIYQGDWENDAFVKEVRDKSKASLEEGIELLRQRQQKDPERFLTQQLYSKLAWSGELLYRGLRHVAIGERVVVPPTTGKAKHH